MLRVGKVGRGGQAYYLEAAHPGPGGEPPGVWRGTEARALGLEGPVSPEAFNRLLEATSPRDGTRLSPVPERMRVAAFDLTFSAPKSVSLLYALADPALSAEVRDGHAAAVDAASSYLERRAVAVRRHMEGTRRVLPSRGVAAADFLHSTSRALDPHLHTHLVVANVGVADGSFSAIDGRGIYAHRATIDALYHAQLREELTKRLGVAWGPLYRGRADILGFEATVRREFSTRSAEISAHLEAGGWASPRAARIAGAATRAPKRLDSGFGELQPVWRDRARAVGFGPRALDAVVDRGPRRARGEPFTPEVAREVAREIADRFSDQRGATRRDVVRAWALHLPSGASVESIERAADEMVGFAGGYGGTRDAPGVAEPRHVVSALRFESPKRHAQWSRIEELEAARRAQREALRAGISPRREVERSREADLGLGFG
jgi:conjugative relaxase-like TrwC/TraI family protein